METTIIGIDHGNGNMKTAHTIFPWLSLQEIYVKTVLDGLSKKSSK